MNDDHITVGEIRRLLDKSAQTHASRVEDRLNMAIAKAMAVHASKQEKQRASADLGGLVTGLGERLSDWFGKPIVSAAVSACFVGAAALGVAQFGSDTYDARITETVDVDFGILSGDLPPDAYLDPGFVRYSNEVLGNQKPVTTDNLDQWIDSLPLDFGGTTAI